MRKILFIILLCIVAMNLSFANRRPVVYVAAPSGISLREAPNKRAPKIITLAYGTRISNYNYSKEWDTVDGYGGNWIRVAVNGKDGYVFGGYTIPVVPPAENTPSMEAYLKDAFGERLALDSIVMSQDEDLIIHSYKKHILYQVAPDRLDGEYKEYTLINLNMSVQEAYLMFYLMNKNIHNFWEFSSEDMKSDIPLNFPQKGKKGEIEVMEKDWKSFEMKTSIGYLKITQYQTNVMVYWHW